MTARSRTIVVAALTGALACVVAGASPAAAADTSGWAGYVATGGTYTSVSASWTVPTVVCTGSGQWVSLWAGLDGYGSSTVEQTGTEAVCSGGAVSYYGWYEMYPAAPVAYGDAVSPGDRMTASVTSDGSGAFTLTLTDATKGWNRTTDASSASAPSASAEVVAEASPVGTGGHSVRFTAASVDGEALAAADPQAQASPGMTVSPIGTSGRDFTVTW